MRIEMNRLGQQFFPRSTLALNQHRDIRFGHLIKRRLDFAHLRIMSEKDLENILHKYQKRAIYMPMRDYFLLID